MKLYSVRIPIAGHALIDVHAENGEDAIKKAFASEITNENIESWDTLKQFTKGNVCFCPQPWQAEATLEDDED
jgi:hypothetical protein